MTSSAASGAGHTGGDSGWSKAADEYLMACVAAQALRMTSAASSASTSPSSSSSSSAAAAAAAALSGGSIDFSAIRGQFMTSPALRFDYCARARSPEELEARSRVLLKAAEREALDAVRREMRERGEDALLGPAGPAGGDGEPTAAVMAARKRTAELIVKALDVYKLVQEEERNERREAGCGGKKMKQTTLAAGGTSSSSGATTSAVGGAPGGGGGDAAPASGSRRRTVPSSLIPLLCRIIAGAGSKGVDSIAHEFLAHHQTVAACGPPPEKREKGKESDRKDGAAASSSSSSSSAAAASGSYPFPAPSRLTLIATIETLGVKSKSEAGVGDDDAAAQFVKATWRLRPAYAHLATATPEQATAELAATPLVLHTAETTSAPAAAGETGDKSSAAAEPTLPEPQLARLAQLIAARPSATADVIVDTFVHQEPKATKKATNASLRAIAERPTGQAKKVGPDGSHVIWAVKPQWQPLLAVPLQGGPLVTHLPSSSSSASASGAVGAAGSGSSSTGSGVTGGTTAVALAAMKQAGKPTGAAPLPAGASSAATSSSSSSGLPSLARLSTGGGGK